MTVSVAAWLQSLGVDAEPGPGWVAVHCPWHDDGRKSASFNESEGRFRCHACDLSGTPLQVLMSDGSLTQEMAEARLSDLPEAVEERQPRRRARRAPRPGVAEAVAEFNRQLNSGAGAEAQHWLRRRGFGRASHDEAMLGLVADPLPGFERYAGMLAIPYLTRSGPVDVRFRTLTDGGPKYLSMPGSRPRLFGASTVLGPHRVIVVAEGEIDALTLRKLCGVAAVGVPGASSWQPHWGRVLDGFERVVVAGDGDVAGRRFANEAASLIDAGVAVHFPAGEDVNSVFVAHGRDAVLKILGYGE